MPVTTAPSTFSIGGSVVSLGSGASVTLLANGSGSANGAFTFPTPLVTDSTYNVTVGTQPSGQTCTVTNGSDTVVTANVTNILVACVATSAGSFAFVANYSGNNVSGYSINGTTGALTPVTGSPFAAGSSPSSMVTFN